MVELADCHDKCLDRCHVDCYAVNVNSDQIRTLRERSILSQEALARNLGVAVRTVARWESGVSKPSPLAIEKLQEIFRLSDSSVQKRP